MKTPLQRAGIRKDYKRNRRSPPEKQVVIQRVPSSKVEVVYRDHKLDQRQMDQIVSEVSRAIIPSIQEMIGKGSVIPANTQETQTEQLEKKIDGILDFLKTSRSRGGNLWSHPHMDEDISNDIDTDISGELAESQGKIENEIENTGVKEQTRGKIDLEKLRKLRNQHKR